MLIIKPYGRSHTEFDDGKTPKRKIRRNPTPDVRQDTLVDVKEFAETHPELIIAQWISAIDKIATKPGSGKKPTPEQRRFREKIGKAAFDLMTQKKFLNVSGREEELKRLWQSKLHPYEVSDEKKKSPSPEGRWYKRFAGDVKPDDVDASKIAAEIAQHLHERECRIKPDRRDKRQSQIAARAESIAKNVLALPIQLPDKKRSWAEQEKAYEKAGDVATEIRQKALEKEKEEKGGKFSVRDVAPILFAQYGRMFKNGNGKPLPIADARERFPGLFELHGAVKDTYTRILKNHRTLKNKKKRSVVHALPASMENLFRLVAAKSDNRDLNALVRLGKIIHYEATPSSGEDASGNIPDNWPKDVERSRYRTSEGQAEIKRTEAFVRVWRNTIALAARTLTDWADPEGKIDRDILLKVEKATGEQFDATAYGQKLSFLFGNRSVRFEGEDDAFRKSVLRLALNGWAGLRHSSFHFKGRGGFVKALQESLASAEDDAVGVARDLLKQDLQGQRDRLIDLLRAAHVEHYFDQEKLDAIVHAVVNADLPQSPLPRFRRVLDRAKNAWNRKPYILPLPPPENRAELEKPGRQCRYVTVKTLYERAFPAWLEKQSAETLNEWIKRAVERTTAAARDINKDEFAVANAARLIRLVNGEGIAHFFDHLSAATATELRVQRGYDSDADNARKQSKYIDDLRCDVVGQAFEEYLKTAKLSWVPDNLCDGPRPEKKRSNLGDVSQPASDPAQKKTEDWEAVLYFLLHLVPVDAVGRLQHQLRKWSILEKKVAVAVKEQFTVADSAGRIFGLYLDMHDAKFEGGAGLVGAEALKGLFESEEAFSQACPGQPGQDAGRYVPWRGLREILRFGCLKPLMPIFQEHHIGAGEVDKLAEWETVSDGGSSIAERQKKREELHEKWAKDKKLSVENKKAYCKALADVVRHRHLAAHARLNNHARLHSLLMEVLGRLVDYAGLWERDLYFTTLALVWLGKKKPNDVFHGRGLDRLKDGRIVEALRELRKSQDNDGKAIVAQLKRLFGEDFLNGKGSVVSVRNNLMHFNMLQGRNPVLNLTETVNDTRRLMAYDRKLKNAVSQSVKEMLAREGLDLTWEMRGHRLECAKIKVRHAIHLKDGRIKENLHGDQFVKMTASLFCGEREPSDDDVLSVDLDKIKWDRQSGQNPKGGWKTHRNRSENRGNKGSFSPRKR